jgi:hypothetical protein
VDSLSSDRRTRRPPGGQKSLPADWLYIFYSA